MFQNSKTKVLFVISSLLIVSLTRFLPHWPNFTALGAMAVFSGAVLYRDKFIAGLLPLFILFVSDLIINNIMYGAFYESFMWFSEGAVFIYSGFLIMAFLGGLLARRQSVKGIMSASITGSVAFYLITNLGAWVASPLYPASIEGLIMSYEAGLPFLLSGAAGDLFFCGVLFGGYALAEAKFPQLVYGKAR